jgi:hypothetical protein
MKQIFYGGLTAVILIFILMLFICIIMVGKILTYNFYSANNNLPYVFWDNLSRYYISDYSGSIATSQRAGR